MEARMWKIAIVGAEIKGSRLGSWWWKPKKKKLTFQTL